MTINLYDVILLAAIIQETIISIDNNKKVKWINIVMDITNKRTQILINNRSCKCLADCSVFFTGARGSIYLMLSKIHVATTDINESIVHPYWWHTPPQIKTIPLLLSYCNYSIIIFYSFKPYGSLSNIARSVLDCFFACYSLAR